MIQCLMLRRSIDDLEVDRDLSDVLQHCRAANMLPDCRSGRVDPNSNHGACRLAQIRQNQGFTIVVAPDISRSMMKVECIRVSTSCR